LTPDQMVVGMTPPAQVETIAGKNQSNKTRFAVF